MPNPRWKIKPAGSTWGDFGPDDQLGRLNLVTPEKVKQGVAEVREGKTFCLSMPLDYPGGSILNPRRNPPVLVADAARRQAEHGLSAVARRSEARRRRVRRRGAADAAIFDAVGQPRACRPGVRRRRRRQARDGVLQRLPRRRAHRRAGRLSRRQGDRDRRAMRARRKLGIENMARACVQGRAVMIDLHAHFGRERKMVGYEDLMGVLEKDKVDGGAGRLRLPAHRLRPGAARVRPQAGRVDPPRLRRARRARRAAAAMGHRLPALVALISDNYAVEAHPSRPCDEHADHCASLPLHAHCLFRLGVYLGEIWYLSELADWLRAQQAQPLPAHRAAAAAARRGRLARDAGRHGLTCRKRMILSENRYPSPIGSRTCFSDHALATHRRAA